MKQYKNIFIAAAIALSAMPAVAQNLNSAYFTDDYKFRHTMNPAYGNEQSYASLPGIGNLNIKLQGNFGYQDVIMDNPIPGGKKMATFMHPNISVDKALSGFNKGDNKINGDIGVTILSAGFKGFGGYNTIELNSKTSLGMTLPYELFEFAKNIGNNTYNIGDIGIQATSYAELALGHSRDINDKLRVGAKIKVLMGLARADVKLENMKADLSANDKWTVSGDAKADISLKGLKYKTEKKEYETGGTYEAINDVDIDGAGIGGFGLALDLGGIYKITDDWTVSASLLDLGYISWSNDMQAVNKKNSFVFDGFHDVAVKGDRDDKLAGKADKYKDQITDFMNLSDNGDQGGRSTGIAATLNVGCEYILPVYRKVKFGALSSTRFQGDWTWTEGRVSANYAPLYWFDGGVSFALGTYGASMGWNLNIHPKGYNFFIGMDRILGKTSKEFIPLSSNASLALGLNVTW